jgi:A/G-specific adenine glycosylase
MDTAALLAWYRRARRRMPWRDEVTPYRTLVSELMLQQTRVETVIPYFERFLEAFPTPEALAEAPVERVLERWSGLGYYSRARNLQAAARAIVAMGGFPRTLEGLRALPGVGPYTAGAVGSIALGLDVPAVDGNVERVLCRHNAWEGPPTRISRQLREAAAALVPPGEAGDFNQALMELGATVCTPTRPACGSCPVRVGCSGAEAPERYPARPPPKQTPEEPAVAVLARRDGRILLARRPETGLLAGLWELPGGPGDDPASVLQQRLGVTLDGLRRVSEVLHVFTHRRLRVGVHAAEVSGTPRPLAFYTDVRWVPAESVDGMALSTLARKTLAAGSGVALPRPAGRRTRAAASSGAAHSAGR